VVALDSYAQKKILRTSFVLNVNTKFYQNPLNIFTNEKGGRTASPSNSALRINNTKTKKIWHKCHGQQILEVTRIYVKRLYTTEKALAVWLV
jgi:hypothetical protein